MVSYSLCAGVGVGLGVWVGVCESTHLAGQAASVVAGFIGVFCSAWSNDVVLVNCSYCSLEVSPFPGVSQFLRIVSTGTGVPHKLKHLRECIHF